MKELFEGSVFLSHSDREELLKLENERKEQVKKITEQEKERVEIENDAENKKKREALEEQEKRENRKAGYKLSNNRVPKIYNDRVERKPSGRK